jgi:sodium/bile acid cotransporter 7
MNALMTPTDNDSWMKQLGKHWFLVSLLAMMVAGFLFCASFESLASVEWIKWCIVSVTMFLMAWPLEFGRLRRAVSRPLAPMLACALNLVLIPLLIWPLASLAGVELGPGMIIAAATPSTLASAAVFTRRAGGDDSVSILATILTNASCFLVMPFWILVQTGKEVESSQLTGTIYKLFFFVVLPIGLAQMARINAASAAWATRQKPFLSILALTGILAMVFLGAVKMGLRFSGQSESVLNLANLLTMLLILMAVHTFVFWFGIWFSGRMGIPREEAIAVDFSGSQKTLMIGLTTAINLGMSIVPIVAYHAFQLMIDAVFAERIRNNQNQAPTD